ncbi:MAG: MarR family transcriptional regulator [Gammaproteobacteria bacterium]|nr:MarR family transcriptional regulator [Gammaproteobacteria bacterium]
MAADLDVCDEVLLLLRRVIRAIDLHSRSLIGSHGLTAPQAIILKELARSGVLTVGEIASRVALGKATVTDILKRLESRGLIRRNRSRDDRRRILIAATPKAQLMLHHAPPPLQTHFITRFNSLPPMEQSQLLAAIRSIAAMMDGESPTSATTLAIDACERASLLPPVATPPGVAGE